MSTRTWLLTVVLILGTAWAAHAAPPLKALILDGQNNHDAWPKTTVMMKTYLENSGQFSVDVARTRYTWRGSNHLANYPVAGLPETMAVERPQTDPDYHPQFSAYDVVISNYNGAAWPDKTRENFVEYVRQGGGFVVVHAANNAFGDWPEYNEIIGLGGWGGRNERSGPYVFLNDDGRLIRDDSPGGGGHHGPQHAFQIIVRDDSHPITQGMPRAWMHAQDELYDLLRGPAANMHILATAYADPDRGGSGRHEPMIFTVTYGEGRVFHTPLGHDVYSHECVGFIVSFLRGTEWAATGKVTPAEIPADFPPADATSQRKFD